MKNPYAKYIKYLEKKAKTGTVVIERSDDFYYIIESYTGIKVSAVEYKIRFLGELLFSGIELENGQRMSIRENVRGAVENSTNFVKMFNTDGYSSFGKSPFVFDDRERNLAIFLPRDAERTCAVFVNSDFLRLIDGGGEWNANCKIPSAPVMFCSPHSDSVFLVCPVKAPSCKSALEELYALTR